MSTDNLRSSYLPRAGLYLGILGVVSLLVFVLIFQQDWTHRFPLMLAMIPVSVIALLISKKLPLVSGLLLLALGIASAVLDIMYGVGTPGQIAGRGLGYTIVFVSLPLSVSGALFIISGIKRFKFTKKADKSHR